MAEVPDRRVSRADIEAKLNELKGEVEGAASSARPIGMAVAAGAAVVVVVAVFLLGRRSGKQRTTVVEIRRV